MILKTITLEHLDLRKVSFHCHSFYNFGDNRTNARTVVGEEMYGHWMDLDRAIIRLWESHAARMEISYRSRGEGERACEFVGGLLPDTIKRGIIKLVDLT